MHAISEPFPGSPFPENLISPRYESELIHEAEIIARRVALFARARARVRTDDEVVANHVAFESNI